MKVEWACAQCKAVNPAAGRFCEACGSEPREAATATPRPSTAALFNRPLCDHLDAAGQPQKPGTMCAPCEAVVDEQRRVLRERYGIAIPKPKAIEQAEHEQRKAEALAQFRGQR